MVNLSKGLLAGAAGGLAGAWAMNLFQSGLSKMTASEGFGQSEEKGEDATVKAADAMVRTVAHRRLTWSERSAAGPAVHYLFGALMGAAYGAAVEADRRAALGWGTAFGTALWAGADEIAVPALGLSGSPGGAPLSSHASALAAHLVYGTAAEGVRRALRAAL